MNPERRILLMCDYYEDPLWWGSDGTPAELDELPLSAETKAALRSWAEWFDRGCEPRFGHRWESAADREAFEREGRRLLDVLRSELGPEWVVGYFSELRGTREWPDDAPDPGL